MSRYTFQSQPSQCQQSVCSRQTSPPRLLIRLHFKIRRQPRGETDYSQHERPGKKGAELVGISSHVIYCITIISLTMGASYNTSDVSYCMAGTGTSWGTCHHDGFLSNFTRHLSYLGKLWWWLQRSPHTSHWPLSWLLQHTNIVQGELDGSHIHYTETGIDKVWTGSNKCGIVLASFDHLFSGDFWQDQIQYFGPGDNDI